MRLIRYMESVDGVVDDVHPLLQSVVYHIAAAAYRWFKKGIMITSVYREPLHEGDLHTLHRAVDFDVDEGNHYDGITPQEAQRLADFINKYVIYDESRPYLKCAVYGYDDPKDKHWNHVHLQVHPKSFVRPDFSS